MAFKRKFSRSRRSKKTRRGRFSLRKGRSFQSRVTQVLMKKSETKFYDIADENVQLYHNNCTNSILFSQIAGISILYNPWADIAKGYNRNERIGDRITPRGMSLKLWIANKQDRPNVMYRLLIVRMPKTIGGIATTNGNTYPFQTANLGANGNHILLPLDQDKGMKALYDRTFNVQTGDSWATNGSTLKEAHTLKKLWIKRKKSGPIVYDGAGQFIVNNPILVYLIPYDSYGTLTTDNIASCSFYCRLYYKDI